MSASQAEKARRFRALHDAPTVFVMPNPWDAGSARILARGRLRSIKPLADARSEK
jgi:2-methylisocitrate lyase-like PEP mutase family enzyme